MKHLTTCPLAVMLCYLLSFSRYNWKNNNKLAALGAAFIGIAAFVLSLLVLFGSYEK